MSKNGTLRNTGSHGQDENHNLAADATDRATAFFSGAAGFRHVPVAPLSGDSMAAVTGSKPEVAAISPRTTTGSPSESRRPLNDARGRLMNPTDSPLTTEVVFGTSSDAPMASRPGHGDRGDGGRFHSAGGLPH